MDPLAAISTRSTPQSQPADARQARNSAGGYTFTLSDMARLRRFLVLGVDGGTYYAKAAELAAGNATVVFDLARSHPVEMVAEIVAVSTAGRAPRQNPALFALAVAASLSDDDGRKVALEALPLVARTGTHLCLFAKYVQQFRGWGRGLRRAVGRWYLGKSVADLAYQVAKYRQREGWTHRDLLRLAHPAVDRGQADAAPRRSLFDWICGREVVDLEALRTVEGLQRASSAPAGEVAALIAEYSLSWEMLPDAALGRADVWEALLDKGMPQTALIRQLPRLTRLGLLSPSSRRAAVVAEQLADPQRLRRGRVHPVAVLLAQRTYAAGHGARGRAQWSPSRPIVDALDAAFYQAFGAVEPAGTRVMLALDVSASMTCGVSGLPISCREASAALALVTAATEPTCEIVGFTDRQPGRRRLLLRDSGLTPLSISPRQRLADAVRAVSDLPFGGTDCSLPMRHAVEQNLAIDTFVIYTDNETWSGEVHPHQALRQYREHSGIDARLVVVAMTATRFSIADPSDLGMLDVAGFDAAVPALINNFARADP